MAISDAEAIRKEAKIRWFSAVEIRRIFANHESLDLLISEQPERPASGSFFMIPRQNRRKFRKDGHLWSKKKDGKTIQESHANLKVRTVKMVECLYVRSQENENFQRRVYRMIKEGPFDIVLFHYREDEKARKSKKTTEVTTPSSQEAAETIPIWGATGDGDESQPFSQETNNNVLLNPDASGGYYKLQALKKSTDQFSERNEKNLKRGRETSENLLANCFDGYQDRIISQQNPDWQENWKAYKHSKTLDISEATGFPSSIVDHAKLGYRMQDCNDDRLPNLSMPGSPRELPELLNFIEQYPEEEERSKWRECNSWRPC